MNYFKKLIGKDRKYPAKPELNSLDFRNTSKLQKLLSTAGMNYLNIAVAHSKSKNYIEAIKEINKSINENPTNHHLYFVRASIKEDSEDYSGAINDFIEGLDISHQEPYGIYNRIAVNYLNMKEFTKALTAFDIAIELKKELLIKGIDESIMPSVVDTVSYGTGYEKIYSNRANCKINLNDLRGALDDCNSAIEANPNYSNSYFLAGIVLANVGQKDQALQALYKAHQLGYPHASNLIREIQSKL